MEYGFAIPTLGIGGDDSAGWRPRQVADLELDVLEPDFTLIAPPTTLRLPQGKFAFRLTHRFSRPLDGREGDGGLVENFFGFDSPAIIDIEFRYGLLPGTQVGFYRSNTRHIQFFARANILWARGPRGLDSTSRRRSRGSTISARTMVGPYRRFSRNDSETGCPCMSNRPSSAR